MILIKSYKNRLGKAISGLALFVSIYYKLKKRPRSSLTVTTGTYNY